MSDTFKVRVSSQGRSSQVHGTLLWWDTPNDEGFHGVCTTRFDGHAKVRDEEEAVQFLAHIAYSNLINQQKHTFPDPEDPKPVLKIEAYGTVTPPEADDAAVS